MIKEIKLFLFIYLLSRIQICHIPTKIKDSRKYFNFINDCKNHKDYNRTKIYTTNPFISVCIPAFNLFKEINSLLMEIDIYYD